MDSPQSPGSAVPGNAFPAQIGKLRFWQQTLSPTAGERANARRRTAQRRQSTRLGASSFWLKLKLIERMYVYRRISLAAYADSAVSCCCCCPFVPWVQLWCVLGSVASIGAEFNCALCIAAEWRLAAAARPRLAPAPHGPHAGGGATGAPGAVLTGWVVGEWVVH